MKTIILTAVIILFVISCKPAKQVSSSSPTHTQGYKAFSEYKGDTLSYLQDNFIKRKDIYKGKELNVLLNDMEIEVKSVLPGVVSTNRYICPDIGLLFNTLSSEIYKSNNNISTYTLNIYWEEPMQRADIIQFLKNNNYKDWSEAYKTFFGSHIIKDVDLVVSHYPNLPKK